MLDEGSVMEGARGMDTDLLSFLKALADANRLRVIGLLAHRPHTVDEIATVLELKPSTVSHHLSRLGSTGLVSVTARGHYHEYSLNVATVHDRARSLGTTEGLRGLAPVEGVEDPFDRKVLSTFLGEDGRIAQFPMKRKKLDVLVRYALRRFEDEGPWDEGEVNARLEELTDDTATLRRAFIDHGYMDRTPGGRSYTRRPDMTGL